MALKATFPAGSTSTTVMGIYQWDYGRELEIEALDLGSEIVEIHFACPYMNEAIVRACTFTDGVGKVTIPDICLEQSNPVTAWIYQIQGTEGHTSKSITLPITARTRPSVSRDIPNVVSDQYTELLTAVNETVEDLKNGDITVSKANSATNANYATSAGNASTANFATSADSANTAGTATTLNAGGYLNKTYVDGNRVKVAVQEGKTYLITFENSAHIFETLVIHISDLRESCYSTLSMGGYYSTYSANNTDGFSIYKKNDSPPHALFTPTLVYVREI